VIYRTCDTLRDLENTIHCALCMKILFHFQYINTLFKDRLLIERKAEKKYAYSLKSARNEKHL
jgi:hypothetical protein